ncbi:hypothetical protein [Salinisphaera sp. T31B1]|uniref:hypothetical protein n=1 Tax=Salinisphaera sp. T31B1 TaxID=727963 RepID=UPI00333EE8F8
MSQAIAEGRRSAWITPCGYRYHSLVRATEVTLYRRFDRRHGINCRRSAIFTLVATAAIGSRRVELAAIGISLKLQEGGYVTQYA